MAEQVAMNILEFQKQFGTDEACRDHLYRIRWPDGLVCPKCGGNDHAWKPHAVAQMILGDIFGGARQARSFGIAVKTGA